ncbi:hypothetical protein SHIRM173S_07496 [Streptomyces hirsutus]
MHNFPHPVTRPAARRKSRAWFATAARAATESGDDQLHAWILAREAMAPLDYGAPKAAAVLADQARHAAGSGPTAAAALGAAVAARAYSLNHQPVRLSRLPTPSWRGSPRVSGRTPG